MESLEILVSIRKIVRALSIESKTIEKEYGLSIPQFLCLDHLQKCPNYQTTQKDLKGMLNLNASTISGLINRLEKKGYVARLPKAGDRRVTHITLTASGIKLIENVPNILHNRLTSRLDNLSTEQREEVKKALEIITSAMQIREIDASPILISDTTVN